MGRLDQDDFILPTCEVLVLILNMAFHGDGGSCGAFFFKAVTVNMSQIMRRWVEVNEQQVWLKVCSIRLSSFAFKMCFCLTKWLNYSLCISVIS